MSEVHILSLGAGVQSTTVYLLAMEGKIRLDCAIFADTQDEPGAVYRHLEWLQSLGGPPIHVATKGKLSQALTTVESAKYGKRTRFAAVPFFTLKPDGEIGQTRRQCSKEYKVEVVARCSACGRPYIWARDERSLSLCCDAKLKWVKPCNLDYSKRLFGAANPAEKENP